MPLGASPPPPRSRPRPRLANTLPPQNAPQYRVHIIDCETGEAGAEIGAAWKRPGERAGESLALVIDDPALPQPIRANLFRDDDAGNAWSLHWSRQPKHDGKE